MAYDATTLQLSATELKALTGWNDPVIVEFLSLQGGMAEVTQIVNIVIEQVTQNNTTLAHTNIVVNNLQGILGTMGQALEGLQSMATRLAASSAAMQREIASLSQSLEMANSANAMLRTALRTQAQVIDSQEQATQQTGALNARLTKLETRISDIEQAQA